MGENETCYWIAVPGRMARRDCDKEFQYLPDSRGLEEKDILSPYVGKPCPHCGKIVVIDEKSYLLIKS